MLLCGGKTGNSLCCHNASCLEPFSYCSFCGITVKTHLEYSSKREESSKIVQKFLSENSTKNNENSKLIRRANGSERPHDRIDSGAFSEGNVFLFLIIN